MCLAVPGEILRIEGALPLEKMAQVKFGVIEKSVCLAFLPQAKEGDYVLVHAGIAISIVQQDEAQRIFTYLDEIGEFEIGESNP